MPPCAANPGLIISGETFMSADTQKTLFSAVMAAAVTIGMTSAAQSAAPAKSTEKCFGVAKAGKN